VILRAEDRIAEGSFADVFAIPEYGQIAKVFRSANDPGLVEGAMAVFAAECAAYDLLGEHIDLAVHAPEYHGPLDLDGVEDANGYDWSSRYLLDCCYVLERIEGPDVSVFEVSEAFPHVLLLVAAFQQIGIAFVTDVTVFAWEDPARTKLIGFATDDGGR